MWITPGHLTSDQMLFLLTELDRQLASMSIWNTELVVVGGAVTTGENPDPTGDFASGRTRVFLDSNEFLAFLDHCHQSATGE